MVVAHTGQLDPAVLRAALALLERAFDDDGLTADDGEHCLGGMHALSYDGDDLVGHAALVQRRLRHQGRVLRAGTSRGVAVRAEAGRRARGAVVDAVERLARGGYDVAALASTDQALRFFRRRGWVPWRGQAWALPPTGQVRTPDADDCLHVLPLAAPRDVQGPSPVTGGRAACGERRAVRGVRPSGDTPRPQPRGGRKRRAGGYGSDARPRQRCVRRRTIHSDGVTPQIAPRPSRGFADGRTVPLVSRRHVRPVPLNLPAARHVLRALAAERAGVLHRPEVVARGVPRWVLQAELRARRWQRTGCQTVVTHNAELTPEQRRVVAVLEVGPRAALDGVTALQHDGVKVEDDGQLHVIAPKGSSPKHPPGVRVHESRRFREEDVVVRNGVRVVVPAVAAVHGALWARSDREARLLAILVVQQRRATCEQLLQAAEAVQRSRRKALLRGVVGDVRGGVRSMRELDLTAALRRRGLPEPDRQVLRQRPSGRHYLDCRFTRFALTLEMDGEQHDEPAHRVTDVLRDLALIADGDDVVRIPNVALLLDEDRVMAALEAVFMARGWRRAA